MLTVRALYTPVKMLHMVLIDLFQLDLSGCVLFLFLSHSFPWRFFSIMNRCWLQQHIYHVFGCIALANLKEAICFVCLSTKHISITWVGLFPSVRKNSTYFTCYASYTFNYVITDNLLLYVCFDDQYCSALELFNKISKVSSLSRFLL